jgi:hypothetical protein
MSRGIGSQKYTWKSAQFHVLVTQAAFTHHEHRTASGKGGFINREDMAI